jgi:hypothetical protein
MEVAVYNIALVTSSLSVGFETDDAEDRLANDLDLIDSLVSIAAAIEGTLLWQEISFELALFDKGKHPIFGGFL